MRASARVDPRRLEGALGTVEEAMTVDVTFVTPDMELGAAARLLELAGVTGAPVVDGSKVVGIVTLGDLLSRIPVPTGKVETTGPFHRWEHVLASLSSRTGLTVGDVMTRRVVTVTVTEPLTRAARLMAKGRISRLPVVDGHGHLRGILSREDVVAAVARRSSPQVGEAASS